MEVKLVVIGGKNNGREIPITKSEFLIGRAEGCNLRPQSDRVSRKHCVIRRHEGGVTVMDLNSTNHTFVNNEQINEKRELKNGDRLKVGTLEFEVQLAVSIGGKKKPKVTSIQEAAARTVQSTTGKQDDLDITNWLEDEEEESSETGSSIDTLSVKETRTVGHKPPDTTAIHTPHIGGPEKQDQKKEDKKEDKKKSTKGAGHLDFKKKVTGKDTCSAAEDTLRHFLHRKK